jgi:argininosuccinate lyase
LASVSARSSLGGTAPQAVLKQLQQAKEALESLKVS